MIALNARAAARPELGGVERWARELAARLPARAGYEVIRPPAALAHRAGHVWEQAVLPARARGARLLLNPANLAPLAFPRNAVVIHDAAALREPGWYSPVYARWQRGILPLSRAARGWSSPSASSRAARSPICCTSTPRSCPAASTRASHPTPTPSPRAPHWA